METPFVTNLKIFYGRNKKPEYKNPLLLKHIQTKIATGYRPGKTRAVLNYFVKY